MEFKRFLGNLAKAVLATGALSVSAFAGADSHNPAPYPVPNPNPYQVPCPPPAACVANNSCCCGEPCLEAPCCGWAYNPPAYCRCNNPPDCCNACDGWGLRLDFLWWRSCVTGVALGIENEIITTGASTTTALSDHRINVTHVKRPDFKFDPGFRLGLINHCACDCWDIALLWTHYHTHANASGESSLDFSTTDDLLNETVFVSFWERGLGVIPDKAESRYSLTLDMLDLEFGRKYYVSNCFILRPFFGLRGARFDQTYRVFSYANRSGNDGGPLSAQVFSSKVRAKNDYLAIGPRLGVELEVNLGCGVAIFGNAAGSLLYGKFDRHSKEYLDDDTLVTSGPFISDFEYEAKSNTDRCSRAFTDLAIGVKWSRCFEWCGRLHPISIAFAWEHHAFWNMNNFNFVPGAFDVQGTPYDYATGAGVTRGTSKAGDIFTQGLTVSANFGF